MTEWPPGRIVSFVPAAFLCLGLTTAPARASVVDAQSNGFRIQTVIIVKAPAKAAYADILQIDRWWPSDHTYSGDAKNMSLDPMVGGCWCEKLPGGGEVQHMRVVYLDPGKVVRLDGGLGPLAEMGVAGRMNFTLAEREGATTITVIYEVGGYTQGGLKALAGPVDGVLTENLNRLKSLIETGKAG